MFYDLTTNCYVANPESILRYKSMFEGHVIGYEVDPRTAIDIDTKIDLEWAEFVMSRRTQ